MLVAASVEPQEVSLRKLVEIDLQRCKAKPDSTCSPPKEGNETKSGWKLRRGSLPAQPGRLPPSSLRACAAVHGGSGMAL
eukprot:4454866-Pyramimonas_sp.AAC.1